MGTHKYVVDWLKSDVDEPAKKLGFRTSYDNSVDTPGNFESYIQDDDRLVRFVKLYGCRERVCDDLHELFNTALSLIKGKFYLTGLRCMGEQYNLIAEAMKNVGNSNELLSSFFTSIFGIKIGIYHSFMTDKTPSFIYKPTGNLKMTRAGVTKSVAGYVNIYYRVNKVDKTKPLTHIISAVAALLREPRIIGKILDGTITSSEGVIDELCKISIDRYCGKDRSYDCWNLGSNPRSSLTIPNNNDGSDFLSIFELGLFVGGISKGFFKGQLRGSGPAECVDNHLTKLQIMKIIQTSVPDFDGRYLTTLEDEEYSAALLHALQELDGS